MALLSTHTIQNREELSDLAFDLAMQLQSGDIILLSGELGAGKTTLTQFLGKALGVKDLITSPTYTLIGEYQATVNPDITTLIHIDLYRTGEQGNLQPLPLNNDYIQEVLDGSTEQRAVVVIEWAELLNAKQKNRTWNIAIKPGASEDARVITVALDKEKI